MVKKQGDGANIVSPFDGTIVTVVNDLKDNIPGEMVETNAAGNHVVIGHAHGEYSMIAHFKKDSIIVNIGERVD